MSVQSVEEGLERARRPQARETPSDDADRDENADPHEHELQDAGRRCTERQPNSQFGASDVNRIRCDSIDAETSEQQTNEAKERRQHRHHAILRQRGVHIIREGSHHQGQIRIHTGESTSHRRGEPARRRSARPDADIDCGQTRRPHARRLRDWHENHRRDLVAQRQRGHSGHHAARAKYGISRHANDSTGRRRLDGRAQWIPPRKEASNERLVDQQHWRCGGGVTIVEVSPLDDGSSIGGEPPGRDEIHDHAALRVRRSACDGDPEYRSPAVQRCPRRCRRSLDTGKARRGLDQPGEQHRSRFRTQVRAIRVHTHDQDTVAVETERPHHERAKCPHQESRRHDEHQRHRNLCRDQPARKSAGDARRLTAVGFQRVHDAST